MGTDSYPVAALKQEIARRRALKPGTTTVFPRGRIGGGDSYEGTRSASIADGGVVAFQAGSKRGGEKVAREEAEVVRDAGSRGTSYR